MSGFRISFVIATGAVLGGLVLAAFLPGQRSAKASRARTDAPAERIAPESTLVAGSGGFVGRVLDADGTPVSRANVTLIDRRGRQAGLTVADEKGHYLLLPPSAGDYVLAGSAAGHPPLARPVAFPGGGLRVEIDLVLAERATERSAASAL